MPDIRLKRAYEDPEPTDGVRILVERLWPRGVSKDRAMLDHWMKDISPSPELRKWYGHDPEKWPEFQRRYRAELDRHTEDIATLRELCASGPVTFVYAAKDEARNSAIVLREYLSGS